MTLGRNRILDWSGRIQSHQPVIARTWTRDQAACRAAARSLRQELSAVPPKPIKSPKTPKMGKKCGKSGKKK
eukprot:1356422-Amphidinium_carterae.1